jgi:ATP-dependent Zn protease
MSQYYVRLFLDWVPFLIFIGLLIYFMKKGIGGRQAKFMDSMAEYYSNHLEETRKINASLDRIASALEKRDSSR